MSTTPSIPHIVFIAIVKNTFVYLLGLCQRLRANLLVFVFRRNMHGKGASQAQDLVGLLDGSLAHKLRHALVSASLAVFQLMAGWGHFELA
jgi:hypothetical protein